MHSHLLVLLIRQSWIPLQSLHPSNLECHCLLNEC
jgi:hypothetical protein